MGGRNTAIRGQDRRSRTFERDRTRQDVYASCGKSRSPTSIRSANGSNGDDGRAFCAAWLFTSPFTSPATGPKKLGTFAISSLGNLGVEQFHPLCPLTTYFTFGPIQKNGDVVAKIIYDHRVMDGRDVRKYLGDLEEILNKIIIEELRIATQPIAA